MVRRKILIVFAVLALAGAIGCRDAYYDKKPVYSAHEYLTREDRADELVYAIQQAGLTGVALIAGSREAPVEAPFPDPGPPPDPNELVLKAFDESKGILIPFVTIAPDDPAPLDTFKALHQRGARGLALWRRGEDGERRLDAPEMEALYQYVELYGVPVFANIAGREFLDELSAVLFDHPEMRVIGAGLLGMPGDLALVQTAMELHNNLYVTIGGDGGPGFEQRFGEILAHGEAASEFFTLWQDRIVFAGGLQFDHRLYRHGVWGMQTLKAYRAFLERKTNRMRLMDEARVWVPREFGGLALSDDLLEKIYYGNFLKVIGKSFQDRLPIEFSSLVLDVPADWHFNPIAPSRLVPALACSHQKLVNRVSTQRLRDIFAGKITDWKELNGEPGPIVLGSVGPLARILSAQLDAPLVAELRTFDTAEALTEAILADHAILGLMPVGALDGRLELVAVNGDNPLVSNVAFCASKSSPTVSTYFPNYPLLVPAEFAADAPVTRFDPYQIRTIVIGGTVRAPQGFDPASVRVKRIVTGSGAEAEDPIAQRLRPVYSILPQIRKVDLAAFWDAGEASDAFLLRALGARARLGEAGIRRMLLGGDESGESATYLVRGLPVTIGTNPVPPTTEGIQIVVLPQAADAGAVRASLAAGSEVVLAGSRVAGLAGLGPVDVPLGEFLGNDGSSGQLLTLSFYGTQLKMAQVMPVTTSEQIVQRRYGPDARAASLAAFQMAESTAAP